MFHHITYCEIQFPEVTIRAVIHTEDSDRRRTRTFLLLGVLVLLLNAAGFVRHVELRCHGRTDRDHLGQSSLIDVADLLGTVCKQQHASCQYSRRSAMLLVYDVSRGSQPRRSPLKLPPPPSGTPAARLRFSWPAKIVTIDRASQFLADRARGEDRSTVRAAKLPRFLPVGAIISSCDRLADDSGEARASFRYSFRPRCSFRDVREIAAATAAGPRETAAPTKGKVIPALN